MVGYFFWVIFTNKISKNSHYYRTGGKLLIHTFSLNSNLQIENLYVYEDYEKKVITEVKPKLIRPNSLKAIDGHDRQLFNELRCSLVTPMIFVRC